MLAQYAEPDFNGVEPATMLGGIDKADAMGWITQIRLSTLHALENTTLAFFS